MFTESRILVAALRFLMEQGVPAMPMHDGIMVPGLQGAGGETRDGAGSGCDC